MDHGNMKGFIGDHRWQEAITYREFCPHEYTVRGWLQDSKDVRKFNEVVIYIRTYGFEAIYGRKEPNQYYIVDDYYYWTMPEPVETSDVLNRARIEDYIFWEDLLGELHCRRRRYGEPIQSRDEVLAFAKSHGQEVMDDEPEEKPEP